MVQHWTNIWCLLHGLPCNSSSVWHRRETPDIRAIAAQRYTQQLSQQTRDVEPMLFYCWASVRDAGLTLKQHWFDVSCLLGSRSPTRTGVVTISAVTAICLQYWWWSGPTRRYRYVEKWHAGWSRSLTDWRTRAREAGGRGACIRPSPLVRHVYTSCVFLKKQAA